MTELTCPNCGPDWHGTYNTDHRCVTCLTPVLAKEGAEDELHKLRRENHRLRDALEAILEESEDLTAYEITMARQALED